MVRGKGALTVCAHPCVLVEAKENFLAGVQGEDWNHFKVISGFCFEILFVVPEIEPRACAC